MSRERINIRDLLKNKKAQKKQLKSGSDSNPWGQFAKANWVLAFSNYMKF